MQVAGCRMARPEFARADLDIAIPAAIDASQPDRPQRRALECGTCQVALERIEPPIGYGGPILRIRAVPMPEGPQRA